MEFSSSGTFSVLTKCATVWLWHLLEGESNIVWHLLQDGMRDCGGKGKGKGVPQQAEVALGVPVRLRPWIISTFGTTRVVGCQPYAPAAFTPGEIPGTHFQKLSRPQGTWFCQKEPRKNSPVTPPGIDLGAVRLVAQRLNHYATPGPEIVGVVAV